MQRVVEDYPYSSNTWMWNLRLHFISISSPMTQSWRSCNSVCLFWNIYVGSTKVIACNCPSRLAAEIRVWCSRSAVDWCRKNGEDVRFGSLLKLQASADIAAVTEVGCKWAWEQEVGVGQNFIDAVMSRTSWWTGNVTHTEEMKTNRGKLKHACFEGCT